MLNGLRRAQELPAVNGQENGKSNRNGEETGATSTEGHNSGSVRGGGETEIAGLRQPPFVSFTQVTSTSSRFN